MEDRTLECRECGNEFRLSEKKGLRGGYIDECPQCCRRSRDRGKMYLGRLGGPHKGAMIEIFRENLGFAQKVINMEKGAGMNPNLGIGSTTSPFGLGKMVDYWEEGRKKEKRVKTDEFKKKV